MSLSLSLGNHRTIREMQNQNTEESLIFADAWVGFSHRTLSNVAEPINWSMELYLSRAKKPSTAAFESQLRFSST